MAKTATLYARIEPEVKEQAEAVFDELGISASSAISLFYRQVALRRGLPFEVALPRRPFPDLDEMTDDELAAKLERGLRDVRRGRTSPVDEAFSRVESELGI